MILLDMDINSQLQEMFRRLCVIEATLNVILGHTVARGASLPSESDSVPHHSPTPIREDSPIINRDVPSPEHYEEIFETGPLVMTSRQGTRVHRHVYQDGDRRHGIWAANSCVFCKGRHESDKCGNFWSKEERWDTISRDRCVKCLQPLSRHQGVECHVTCHYCEGNDHHTCICQFPDIRIHALEPGNSQSDTKSQSKPDNSHKDNSSESRKRKAADERGTPKRTKPDNSESRAKGVSEGSQNKCVFCYGPHFSSACEDFKTFEQRVDRGGPHMCRLCLAIMGEKGHVCRRRPRPCFQCREASHHTAFCNRDSKARHQEDGGKTHRDHNKIEGPG